MVRLARCLFLLALFSWNSSVWADSLVAKFFPAGEAPAGCQKIPGLFPYGDRTAKVWTYNDYAVVMPPYKRKEAQSYQCGNAKGTLYFFDYATEEQKDRALLFLRPVLAKQHGLSHELPIQEKSTGFVIVSFSEAPGDLTAELAVHPSNKTASAPPRNAIPPVKPIISKPAVIVSTPVSTAAVSTPPAPVPVPVPSSEPFAQPKPSISSHPFESNEPTQAIHATKPVEPPPLPKPVKIQAPEPVREHPHPAPAIPPSVPTGKVTPAPATGTADLSSSVLESYASKMGCESAERNLQTQMVCGYMQEFASGLAPELPLKADAVLIGPVYTVDANGRFTDLHYDALGGTRDPEVVSLVALPSNGGKDDFEIKQLLEARRAKAPLPENDTQAHLASLLAAKRFGLRKSAARSAILQPTPEKRLFIRRAGDHWVVVGVSGNTAEAQLNTALSVLVLY